MATRRVATVFGGSGFIGRYVVKRLAQRGYVVRVAVRDPEGALFLKPMGAVGQIVPLFTPLSREPLVRRAVEGAELVVNCVGILAEGGRATFQSVVADGAKHIAAQAAASGVSRLVQVSAIGADATSQSRYGAAKGTAEQSVTAAFPRATILRPSLVFGPEDQFFNRFAEIARLSPFMPVICGDTKMQPVYVGDVADAAMVALTDSPPEPRTSCDPPLGLSDLGIAPTPVELIVSGYLARFQPGGGRRLSVPTPERG